MRTCRYCEKKFDPELALPTCEIRAPEPCEGKPRGFATMDKTRILEVASKGGKKAHASGAAHQFSPDEARKAGKLGGDAPHVRRGPIARTPAPKSNVKQMEANAAEEGE